MEKTYFKTWFTDPVYLMLAGVTGFLAITASGFIWYDPLGLNAFAHRIYHSLCHQFPWRTIAHGGDHMAVCSRCFGIYSGTFLLTLLMPLIRYYRSFSYRSSIYLLAGAFLLNFVDIFGNLIGIWTNTLYSRFVLGFLFGMSVIFIILVLYKPKLKHNKKNLWNLSGINRPTRVPHS